MQGNLIVIQTESAGTFENYNLDYKSTWNWPRLIQLSWAICSPDGQIISETSHFIKPNGFIIPWAATKEHGIDNAKVNKEGLMLSIVLDKFEAALEGVSMLVGHHLYADYNILMAEYTRIGRKSKIMGIPQFSIGAESAKIIRQADEKNLYRGQYDGFVIPTQSDLKKKLFPDSTEEMTGLQMVVRSYFGMQRPGTK